MTISCSLQDSSQIELLKELMDLLKDVVVMLLSMLEGMNQFFFFIFDILTFREVFNKADHLITYLTPANVF